MDYCLKNQKVENKKKINKDIQSIRLSLCIHIYFWIHYLSAIYLSVSKTVKCKLVGRNQIR